jgi:hypothetical protein
MDMELIVIVAIFIGGLALLDVPAIAFGVDSRDGMQDDWARQSC